MISLQGMAEFENFICLLCGYICLKKIFIVNDFLFFLLMHHNVAFNARFYNIIYVYKCFIKKHLNRLIFEHRENPRLNPLDEQNTITGEWHGCIPKRIKLQWGKRRKTKFKLFGKFFVSCFCR